MKVLPIFFDTEFTSLLDPKIWSIGMVTLEGEEFYAELDPHSEVGRTRLAATPWDVREIVLEQFGQDPQARCESDWALGDRAGKWLLDRANTAPVGGVELLYDYDTDMALLAHILQECNVWPHVRLLAGERNIGPLVGTIGPELAADATYAELRRRSPSLARHHALADAIALRASWQAWHLVQRRSADFGRLLKIVGPSREGWLFEWLAVPTRALEGCTPLDLLDRAEGVRAIEVALRRLVGTGHPAAS